MAKDQIIVRGARSHNLKNIDVTIPRDKLVVMDPVFPDRARARWLLIRFTQKVKDGMWKAFSAYARQFLGQMDKPDVDSIDGLSPAIAIDQKTNESQSAFNSRARLQKSTISCACFLPVWGIRFVRMMGTPIQQPIARTDGESDFRAAGTHKTADTGPDHQRKKRAAQKSIRGHQEARLRPRPHRWGII